MSRFVQTCLLLFLAVLPLRSTQAQLYDAWHRPTDVRYDWLKSSHFRVIYQLGLEDEAREMAAILEGRLPEARTMVGLVRRLDAPVVLNRFTDRGNGFVTALPFRQEIEAVANRSKSLSPRFRGWLETVGPHELLHAVHAESGRGVGVGWLLRLLGPDLARSLNLSGPRGINEGAAVWFESGLRPGVGRLSHSLFEMEFRAAMLSGDPWNLTQMLEPSSFTRPFDRYYHGGAHLFEYLADEDGAAFFRRARQFFYRFPLLGYGPALWYGTGMRPSLLGRRLRDHYVTEAEAFVESLGELTSLTVLATGRGVVHRRPTWISDSSLVVYSSGYHLRPGFYRVNGRTGAKTLLRNEAITEDVFFDLTADSTGLLYSRYVPDVFEPIRSTAEVFRLDMETGDVDRLTRGGRVFAPVESPGGTLWAVRSGSPFTSWASLEDTGKVGAIRTFDRTTILSVVPASHGGSVAVLANHEGRQSIYRPVGRGARELRPWIVFEDASIYDVSWSSDAKWLLFSADPGGVSNIFACDVDGDRIYRLTNVPFGAIEPSLSPDGSTLAFVNYRHERYDLALAPFDPDSLEAVPVAVLAADPAPIFRVGSASDGDKSGSRAVASPSAETEAVEAGSYRPLLNVRPRVFYPFFLYQRPTGNEGDVHLGVGVGAGVEWSDPLQYWTAHTSAFYQKGSVWGNVLVRSGRYLLRPSLQLFREPSTVVVRIQREGGSADTVRVGRDERGVGVGVAIPAVFESNVFSTSGAGSVAMEYREERLFDDAARTLREPDGRLTLRPAFSLGYRMQSNPRDIVPNAGLELRAASAVDLWSEADRPARWGQLQARMYLPFLRRSSTGMQAFAHALAQNTGGIVDLTGFFPRGYETETLFLGRGVFARYGIELTQPLWYIDDGFFLLPLYFKSLFAYGFLESMQSVSSSVSTQRRTVAGGGVGLQMRFAHHLDVTLRVAPAYRFASRDWEVTFR